MNVTYVPEPVKTQYMLHIQGLIKWLVMMKASTKWQLGVACHAVCKQEDWSCIVGASRDMRVCALHIG